MNLVLTLTPEIEAKLHEQSILTGKIPEELALGALEEQLAVASQPAPGLSADEWVADLRAWAASHRHLPFNIDDGRESIYAGRDE